MNAPARTAAPQDRIVIAGGGHAGVQLAAALAAAGAGHRVHLVCDEAWLPYQRPPLSKAFLRAADEAVQLHRTEAWFAEQGITVHVADAAVAIDRATRSLRLASGLALPWHQLVLATGARARRLPGLGADLRNVMTLRTAADALRLRHALAAAGSVTVLGGGFIGLEIAATARTLGKPVTVLEAAPRLLQRSVSPELAAHVLATHQASGMDIRLGAVVSGLETRDLPGDGSGLVTSLVVNGRPLPVDLLVLGVGACPDTTLAEAAGLACGDGVLVNARMQTSDPAILAIGDCARWTPASGGTPQRLESVQNANDQARTACATLLGQPAPYSALPWFWSEQGPLRLQMAGLMPSAQAAASRGVAVSRHRRPGPGPSSFSILHYAGTALCCVESVNAPMDHMVARKLLEAGRHPTPEQACDPALPLQHWL